MLPARIAQRRRSCATVARELLVRLSMSRSSIRRNIVKSASCAVLSLTLVCTTLTPACAPQSNQQSYAPSADSVSAPGDLIQWLDQVASGMRGAGPSALPVVAILGVVVGIAYLFSDNGQMQFYSFMDEVQRLDAEISAESDFERRQSMAIWGIARAVFSTTNGISAVRDIVTNLDAARQLGSAWLAADDAFWQATSLEQGSSLSNFIGGYGFAYRQALAAGDLQAAQKIELLFVSKELSLIGMAQQASVLRVLPASTDGDSDDNPPSFDPNDNQIDPEWLDWHAKHPDATAWDVKSEAYKRYFTEELVKAGEDAVAARELADKVVEEVRTREKAKWDAWELERAKELMDDGLAPHRATREAQTLRNEEGLREMLRRLGRDERVIADAITSVRHSRSQVHRRQLELAAALEEAGLSREEALAAAEVVRQRKSAEDFAHGEWLDSLLEDLRSGNLEEAIEFLSGLAHSAAQEMDSTDPMVWYETPTTRSIYEHARRQVQALHRATSALRRGLRG